LPSTALMVCPHLASLAAVTGAVLARVLWTMQEAELDGVRDGARDLACPGCGVVHCGGRTLLRRGRRCLERFHDRR